MNRPTKSVLSVAGVVLAAATSIHPLAAQEAAPAAPKAIALSGSVKKPGSFDSAALSALARYAVLAKVPGPSRYRGTFATEGAALLVDRLRPLVPHHHEKIDDPRFAPGAWFGVPAREKLDVSSCAGCHDGGKFGKIDAPRGLCLVPTRAPTARTTGSVSVAVSTATGPSRERASRRSFGRSSRPGQIRPSSSSSSPRATAIGRSTPAARSSFPATRRTSSSSTPNEASRSPGNPGGSSRACGPTSSSIDPSGTSPR